MRPGGWQVDKTGWRRFAERRDALYIAAPFWLFALIIIACGIYGELR